MMILHAFIVLVATGAAFIVEPLGTLTVLGLALFCYSLIQLADGLS